MGGIPSRLRGHIFTRNKQRFNIETRTEKLLDQEKLPPAPRYPSDEESLKKVRLEYPSALEEIKSKDSKLEENLKQVFVRSFDPPGYDPDINRKMREDPKRPLPQKYITQAPWSGFHSTTERVTPKGKLSLDNLNLLLASFHKGQSDTPVADLSSKYNLNPSDVQKLVEYHSLFTMFEVQTKSNEPDDPYVAKDDWVTDHQDQMSERQNVTLVPDVKKPSPQLSSKDEAQQPKVKK